MKKRLNFLAAMLALVWCGGVVSAGDLPKEITTGSGVKMVLIPAGSFKMGDGNGKADEMPVHEVTLDAFYMDAYEVSQDSFQALTGTNPSKFRDRKGPVECIRWPEAAKYCNARSLKDGLKPCYDLKTLACDFTADGYRLPTEAEWEYACRAGSDGDYFFNGREAQLDIYTWYRNNSAEKVHPVGAKRPNAWGLYDMYGNVMEWCHDFYGPDYYAKSPAVNPTGPSTGDKRVLRGGGWSSRPKDCKSWRRFADNPVTADICQGYDNYGFRCVRKATAK